MVENEKTITTESEQELRREIVITNLRWQVVILAMHYIIPFRRISNGYFADLLFDPPIAYLMTSAVGLGGAALLYLFFTKISQGKFLRNQRFISLIMTYLLVATSWNRFS